MASMTYAAAGCSSTSKATSQENEDCFDISRLPTVFTDTELSCQPGYSPFKQKEGSGEQENEPEGDGGGAAPSALFAAVFDGHGGRSVSTFAAQHLKQSFMSCLGETTGSKGVRDEDVLSSFQESFELTDRELFSRLEQHRHETEQTQGGSKSSVCTCKFFLENPCRCMKSKLHAREGSTATAVVLLNQKVYVASIGDSEAVAFSFDQLVQRKKEREGLFSQNPDRKRRLVDMLARKALEKRKQAEIEEKQIDVFAENGFQHDNETTCLWNDENVQLFITDYLFMKQHQHYQQLQKQQVSDYGSSISVFDDVLLSDSEDELPAEFILLSQVDTPRIDQANSDYVRISTIAGKLRSMYLKEGIELDDGIKRGRSGRFNYVRFPGAHSLNMTRAFGNFGHKRYRMKDKRLTLDTENSPIISTPHVETYNLENFRGNYFLVIGSDGLWDNLGKEQVHLMCLEYLQQNVGRFRHKIDRSEKFGCASESVRTEILLAVLAEGLAKQLVDRAVSVRRKVDDVTAVVIIFQSILNLL